MAKCDRCDRVVPASDLKSLLSWYQTHNVKDICAPCEKELDSLMQVQRERNAKEIQQFLDKVNTKKRFVPLFTRFRRIW